MIDRQICDLLIKIHHKWQKSFGKIAQSLLAISLHELGWRNIRNHVSEDADIDAIDSGGNKYAFEVKTSPGAGILIQRKDIVCLRQRCNDGYTGYITALRVCGNTTCIVTPVDHELIRPGKISFSQLSLANNSQLSESFNAQFSQEIKKYYAIVYDGGLKELLEIMEKSGIESVE